MDNMNDGLRAEENMIAEASPVEVTEAGLEEREGDEAAPEPFEAATKKPRRKLPPRMKKYLKKTAVKFAVGIVLFVGVFYVLNSEYKWKEQVKAAVSYILNEQIDLDKLRENTETIMELFYERLFSNETG